MAINEESDDDLSTTANVVISITDINDHAPVFNKSSYDTSISELTPDGSYVLTVSATDGDEPNVSWRILALHSTLPYRLLILMSAISLQVQLLTILSDWMRLLESWVLLVALIGSSSQHTMWGRGREVGDSTWLHYNFVFILKYFLCMF